MDRDFYEHIDLSKLETPCYVCDEESLQQNLDLLLNIRKRTGCTILLALKGFAMYSLFPLMRSYLQGVSASSLHEARLGTEEFGKEVHVYAPAYKECEFQEMASLANTVIFNSLNQWDRFKGELDQLKQHVELGIRVNPEYSEVAVPMYDPCSKGSRLGVTRRELEGRSLEGVSGFHLHTCCQQQASALKKTVEVFVQSFGDLLGPMKWVNCGGGQMITHPSYDTNLLCEIIHMLKARHHVEVVLEPGEAVVYRTGVLVATVLDVLERNPAIAILDTSASAHMPDVLEMPYRPAVAGAEDPGVLPYTYCLGGLTCLAGDVMGDYSFSNPLHVGDKIIFLDMAQYTMVKNTTFNGVRLPSLAICQVGTHQLDVIKRFSYQDYKSRLS